MQDLLFVWAKYQLRGAPTFWAAAQWQFLALVALLITLQSAAIMYRLQPNSGARTAAQSVGSRVMQSSKGWKGLKA